MAAFTRTYREPVTKTLDQLLPSNSQINQSLGSHMPLDTNINWNWSNPLIVLPLLMVALFVFALLGVMFA
jgi:hypothetical protein